MNESAQAAGNEGIGEIVVTAQRRSESLQKTPIAITAITSAGLRAAGVTDLTGLSKNSPALVMTEYPSSPSTLVAYIRGQGAGDPMMVTRDGSVGVYVDGMYLSRPQSMSFDLADVERVEILRGPQGTLYGRNTTGGAINIISKKPTGELGIDGTVDVGNYSFNRELVNVNLPAVGNLSAKVTVLNMHRDGWVKNIGKGTGVPKANNFNKRDEQGARVALNWNPTSSLTFEYAFDYGHSKVTPQYYVNQALVGLIPGYTGDPSRTYRGAYLPSPPSETFGNALIASWQVSPDVTLRSLTGQRHLNFRAYGDYMESFFVPFLTSDHIVSNSFTQEFQIVGKMPAANIDYTFGAFYFRESARHLNTFDINAAPAYLGGANDTLILKDRRVNALSKSYALYGQATWHPAILDERIGLTVGARYTRDKRDARRDANLTIFTAAAGTKRSPLTSRDLLGPGTFFDTGTVRQTNHGTWSRFNPSVTLDFQATPDVNVYAKYATGYKSGGFTENATNFALAFSPESVKNFELGLKSELFDRRVRFNLAAFIEKFSDRQIDFTTDPNDLSVVQIINAGSATVKGIEAELTVRPVSALTVNASYSYLHQNLHVTAPAGTVLDPAINPTAPTPVGGDVSTYFRIPFTPKHNLNVNGTLTVMKASDSDLTFYAAYTYRGKQFASAGSGPIVPGNGFYARPGYDTVDLRLTYRRDMGNNEISVSAWGKNVLDKRYIDDFVIANGGSILTGYSAQAAPYGLPATYGVQLGFRF